jgi:hypothetical protein
LVLLATIQKSVTVTCTIAGVVCSTWEMKVLITREMKVLHGYLTYSITIEPVGHLILNIISTCHEESAARVRLVLGY